MLEVVFSVRSIWNKCSQSIWFNVGLFSFLLNFVWELAQVPFFLAMPDKTHADGILICALAALGDVLISCAGYGAGILHSRNSLWLLSKQSSATGWYLACGVILTVLFEGLATGPFQLWEYSKQMPIVPVLGTGLAPLMQWVILPMPILWLARRQILGGLREADFNQE